jgi:orotate phosphoribosyltransferase
VGREQVLKTFEDCGALLKGHFLLSSGLHSPGYLQCALVCQHPGICARLCDELARELQGVPADVIAGPAMGGIIPAYELARALRVRGIFFERDDNGRMRLRRGFGLTVGERVIVAEDVMTTGGSVAEIVEAVEAAGAELAGIACLVDRGGARRFAGRPTVSLLQIEIPTYPPDECPLCKEGVPLAKPGSRKEPAGG